MHIDSDTFAPWLADGIAMSRLLQDGEKRCSTGGSQGIIAPELRQDEARHRDGGPHYTLYGKKSRFVDKREIPRRR